MMRMFNAVTWCLLGLVGCAEHVGVPNGPGDEGTRVSLADEALADALVGSWERTRLGAPMEVVMVFMEGGACFRMGFDARTGEPLDEETVDCAWDVTGDRLIVRYEDDADCGADAGFYRATFEDDLLLLDRGDDACDSRRGELEGGAWVPA